MLTFGTRVRGLRPGRSRWIFRASEKSSACLPSEGKWKNLSHVPAFRHIKEPSTYVNYECANEIPCIVPSFASRGLSCLCGTWHLWRWMRGTHWGKGTIGLQAAVPKGPTPDFFTEQSHSLVVGGVVWIFRAGISCQWVKKFHWGGWVGKRIWKLN